MNTVLLTTTLLVLFAQDVKTSQQPATQLYVKSTPPGAAVVLDGKTLGKSDGLFSVTPGAHALAVRMEGYAADERSVEVRPGQILRVELELKKVANGRVVLGRVGDSSDGMRSFADSGHAVSFERPAGTKSVVAVQLFGARYGYPEPPKEDFHVYLLDPEQKVLEDVPVPYSSVQYYRGDLQWHTFEIPPVAVPEKFFVAVWFNAEERKGVYVGMDKSVQESHSYSGLPDKGYRKLDERCDWMIRAVVAPVEGKKPSYPKVTTYEAETPADTEKSEALPARTWNDSTGAFSVKAEFAGVEDGKVRLKKADGKIVAVPLDRLSKEDQDFVASNAGEKPGAGKGPAAAETRELAHDDGTMANKSSIAGGGHAVRFEVDGDSWYVTSVSLHGSRYGLPRPPKEDFRVWICDERLKPIATFRFPYASYGRGEPVWKSFRVKPTRVPRKFVVCFGFNPEATKGVYVSFDAQGSDNSLVGVPGETPPRPFAKGDWLIRAKVENRPAGGSAKTEK